MVARRRVFAPILSAALIAAAAGCDDTPDVDVLSGDIEAVDRIDFGDVQVGIEQPFVLEVKNSGNGTIQVTDIDTGGGFAAEGHEFAVRPRTFALAPNQVQEVTVTFLPFVEMEDAVDSEFTIVTNATKDGAPVKHTVAVVGRGIRHGLEVVPNPVAFGNVLIGSTRIITVEIFNRLSVPVPLLTEVDADGRPLIVNQGGLGRFTLESPVLRPNSRSLLPEDEMLGPNESITVELQYIPDPAQEDREDMGRWTIANCERAQCDLDVTLTGRGTNAAIECQPGTIDFGQVNPGARVVEAATCTNTANDPVTLLAWRLASGTASEYSLVNVSEQARSLSAGESFDVQVAFEPTEATVDTEPAGVLLILGSNPQAQRNLRDAQVQLRGTAGGPDIDVLPTNLSFGQIAVGTASRRRILVQNLGYNDLTVSTIDPDVAATGAFLADKQTFVVPRGGAEVVEVTFTAMSEGLVESQLRIESDDVDEPEVLVQLTGRAITLPPCSYSLAPPQLRFGIVEVLRSTTQGLRIQNIGTDDCLINDVEVLPGSDTSFALIDAGPSSVMLPAGETLTVLVDYTPRTAEDHTGELGFYISDPNDSTPRVDLTGRGSESALLISPNEIDFGKVAPDCSTRARIVTIYNTGVTTTRIERIELPAGVTTEFKLENMPMGIPAPPGASLAPGQSIDFEVRYEPTAIGPDTGFFHVYEENETEPYVIPLFGEGALDPINEDVFEQLETPEVDILFVIDNSCSMSAEQASLTNNFQSFLSFADAQALDYQIAVVSTDVDSCPSPTPAERPNRMDQGRCGYFADGSATGQQDPNWRMITPDERPSPNQAFAAIATQGINGSGAERGLQAAHWALSAPRITGWNAGFLRPDAYLALVFVADEDDQSNNTVDFYVNYFRAIKGFRNTHLFSASAIVGDAVTGCGGQQAEPGTRYISTAQQTGGVVESICTASWARSLENLGLSVFGYKSRFFLSNQPEPMSVQVTIDGVPVDATAMNGQVRWTYDPVTNSVNFAPLAIPEPGTEIIITYRAECL